MAKFSDSEENSTMEKSQLIHHHSDKLKNYSPAHRRLEIASIIIFFALMIWLVSWCFIHRHSERNFALGLSIFLGYISADFVSGFVHWAADTWGSVDWPVVGSTLIRPFREHHVDPKAITRHDAVETNGDNCLITLPLLIVTALYTWTNEASDASYFIIAFICSLSFFVLLTNQIHKWSHQEKNLWPVRLLQNCRLILHPQHHDVHHRAPFNKYYCITTGWLNYPLSKILFFTTLEKFITQITKAIPRADDIGAQAAQDILRQEAG